MAIKTTLEQIEEVQTALAEVQASMSAITSGSQSYSVGDRRKDSAAYQALVEREKVLMDRLDVLTIRYRREQGRGGLSVNIGIPRRDY